MLFAIINRHSNADGRNMDWSIAIPIPPIHPLLTSLFDGRSSNYSTHYPAENVPPLKFLMAPQPQPIRGREKGGCCRAHPFKQAASSTPVQIYSTSFACPLMGRWLKTRTRGYVVRLYEYC